MFFMGEEIGAQRKVTYGNSPTSREDILGERNRQREGALLYRSTRNSSA